jgi:hypothetical protein
MITAAAPGEGWVLVARRRLMADKVYNAGSAIEPAALGRNISALLRTGLVVWLPPHTPINAQPSDLPPAPEPPAKRPKLRLVRLSDPVSSWHESYREARKHFANDADAMDFLMSFEEARSLFKLATATAVAREKAKYKGQRQSITPDMVGM